MSWKFSSNDFIRLKYMCEVAANIAQAKLDEWLSSGVKVYSCPGHGLNHWHKHTDATQDTHTALLINIKPIERECKHDAVYMSEEQADGTIIFPIHKCTKCGKKLKAEWRVCE